MNKLLIFLTGMGIAFILDDFQYRAKAQDTGSSRPWDGIWKQAIPAPGLNPSGEATPIRVDVNGYVICSPVRAP